jgi:hypothetical protein
MARILRTHARVALFIQHDPPGHDLLQEGVALGQPAAQPSGRSHNQVEGENGIECQGHACRLVKFIPGLHHDQEVHIAVRVRCAMGVRAEQNDLIWVVALDYLPREAANSRHRDVWRPIAIVGPDCSRGS